MAANFPDSTLVDFSHVRFGYGARVILDDVSFSVPRGKVTALMGASGGGKTTVLRLIGGQYRAQSGDVVLQGKSAEDGPLNVGTMDGHALYLARRRMGMLFQFGALFTDLSVFDNVAFPMREHTDLSPDLIRDIVLMKLNAVGLRGARDLHGHRVRRRDRGPADGPELRGLLRPGDGAASHRRRTALWRLW